MLSRPSSTLDINDLNNGIVILTFDIEDFINDISILALQKILSLLKKHSIKGIFFITGHVAEKLEKNHTIVEFLTDHEIGYHSSSHSVRPTIPEFTDDKSFSRAVKNSLKRETSHINPINGEIDGVGGIEILRELFSNKKIDSFRAPGFCWTPPHLEALKIIGIKNDFSSGIHGNQISPKCVFSYKGINFFPYPSFITYTGHYSILKTCYHNSKALFNVLNKKITCLIGHEWDFTLSKQWDSIYWNNNPEQLQKTKSLENKEIVNKYFYFEKLLNILKKLHKKNLINIVSDVNSIRSTRADVNNIDVIKTYKKSMDWSINNMRYKPKYQLFNFYKFFNISALKER